ncbi:hypothetical protein WAK64_19045 [Bacillus spongiae]|uniref:Uncharacterized protein n=1 Tax=Bacillus spongiae TaxID=2683610 RepID=A0ABU8HII0_9BACI
MDPVIGLDVTTGESNLSERPSNLSMIPMDYVISLSFLKRWKATLN